MKDLSSFSAVAKMLVHNMVEIEREVEFSVLYSTILWNGSFNIRCQQLILISLSTLFLCARRLYNLADMLGCRAVLLPSTEQIAG